MNLRYFRAILAATTLAGCVTQQPQQVAPLSEISIASALRDIIDGIAQAQKDETNQGMKPGRLGLYACEVQATFNVKASAQQTDKLVLQPSLKLPPPVSFGLSGTAERDATSSGSKGNTVVLLLANPKCAFMLGNGKATASQSNSSKGTGAKPNPSPSSHSTGAGVSFDPSPSTYMIASGTGPSPSNGSPESNSRTISGSDCPDTGPVMEFSLDEQTKSGCGCNDGPVMDFPLNGQTKSGNGCNDGPVMEW